MESKQSGITFLNSSYQNNSLLIKKRVGTPRSTSLYGISRYDGDSYDAYNDYRNYNNRYSSQFPEEYPSPRKMTSIVERRSPSMDKDEIRDNFSTVLREKMPNNEIFNSNESWLCDVDIFREKMRAKHLLSVSNQRQTLSRYRFSESEKDKMPPSLYIDPTKRRIRARSESEPNDISNMRYWTHPDELDIRQEDKIFKRNDDQQIQINERTINYNLPSPPPLSQKRESPSRVLIYNQNLNSNSGALKKPNRFRSHSVLSPTRSSGARRCKTKSPSPTFRGKSFSPVSPFRKSKSATLPSRTTALPERIAASTKPTQITDYIKINPIDDDSFLEDEDDLEEGAENDNCEESSSSDSEDGYKVHAYGDHADKSPTPIQLGSQTLIAVRPSSLFIPSLFPNVPPHLAFSTHEEKGPPVPPELYKVLKWKLTSVMPRVVRSVLINSGFRLLKKTHEWMGTWGKHMKSPCFKAIRPYQKINHLPGSFKLGRKDACWKNLQKKMVKFGKKEFGFMPKTYIIPQDLKALRKAWPRYSHRNFKWIIKPPASARGTGIKVINRWSQIPKRKPVIVQRYIEKPLLINGSKFDLRLYVLITSMNPLRVYMYHDGLVRFASVKYSERSDTLNDRCMHLTNYSINKYSSHYSKNEDVNACHGHKWTLKSLWSYFNSRGINTGRLWAALRNLVLRTILSAENTITGMVKLNLESKYSCFELFGFDVILDSELVPWLLEVNISPSLHSELPLDIHVKAPLVQAVLNTALYNVPPKLSAEQQKDILNKEGLQGSLCYDKRLYINYLSREEKLKHHEFTRKDLEDREEYLNAILHDLTPDDVRCLIVTEDEFSRCFPLERIFPTQYSHKYLKYTESPRYYNRLLDAWEHRYAKNRNAGIRLLRELCANKYHLEVPPAPVKRDSNDETNNNKCNESGMDAKDNNKINKTEKSDQTSPAATLERIQQIVKSANNKYPYGRNNKCFSIKSTVNINSAKNREILGDDDNLETIEITTKFFLSSKDDGFND